MECTAQFSETFQALTSGNNCLHPVRDQKTCLAMSCWSCEGKYLPLNTQQCRVLQNHTQELLVGVDDMVAQLPKLVQYEATRKMHSGVLVKWAKTHVL